MLSHGAPVEDILKMFLCFTSFWFISELHALSRSLVVSHDRQLLGKYLDLLGSLHHMGP